MFMLKTLSIRNRDRLRFVVQWLQKQQHSLAFLWRKVTECKPRFLFALPGHRRPFSALLDAGNNSIAYRPVRGHDTIPEDTGRIQLLRSKPWIYGRPAFWRKMTIAPGWASYYSLAHVHAVYVSNLGRVFNAASQAKIAYWHRRDISWKRHINNRLNGVRVCSGYQDSYTAKQFTKIVVIAQSNGAIYGHFLIEMLPRIGLADRAIAERLPVYIGLHHAVYTEALGYAGIEQPQLVDATKVPLIYAKEAILPIYTLAENRAFPDFAVKTLCKVRKNALRVCNQSYGRRLYVVREGIQHRQITNADEVERFMQAHGFVTIRPETMIFSEQVAAFAQAEVVAGCHGSAMFNCVFCNKNAIVFDLFPACCITTLYRVLAAFGIRYIPVQSPEGSMMDWFMKYGFSVHIHYLAEAFSDFHIGRYQDRL